MIAKKGKDGNELEGVIEKQTRRGDRIVVTMWPLENCKLNTQEQG